MTHVRDLRIPDHFTTFLFLKSFFAIIRAMIRTMTLRRIDFYLRRYATRELSLGTAYDSMFAFNRAGMRSVM